MKATFIIDEYVAVLPLIQNLYTPEQEGLGWTWGFKYTSGVFEYFHVTSENEARRQCDALIEAIDAYWENKA